MQKCSIIKDKNNKLWNSYNRSHSKFAKSSEEKTLSLRQRLSGNKLHGKVDSYYTDNIAKKKLKRSHINTFKKFFLRQKYEIENDTVFDFIMKEKVLQYILIVGFIKIKRFFPNEKLLLKLCKDYDDGNHYLQLSILTNDTIEESYNKLKEFGDFWWYLQFPKTKGKMSITIDKL